MVRPGQPRSKPYGFFFSSGCARRSEALKEDTNKVQAKYKWAIGRGALRRARTNMDMNGQATLPGQSGLLAAPPVMGS